MTDTNKKIQKKDNYHEQQNGDELILVPLNNEAADMEAVYTLNEMGAFIWNLIDGNKTINDLAELIVAEFQVNDETAKKDLLDFLSHVSDFIEYESS